MRLMVGRVKLRLSVLNSICYGVLTRGHYFNNFAKSHHNLMYQTSYGFTNIISLPYESAHYFPTLSYNSYKSNHPVCNTLTNHANQKLFDFKPTLIVQTISYFLPQTKYHPQLSIFIMHPHHTFDYFLGIL